MQCFHPRYPVTKIHLFHISRRYNNTLLTSAPATERTKGRISLKGYWGDIISGPFACWGCESLDRDVLETKQQQVRVHSPIIMR